MLDNTGFTTTQINAILSLFNKQKSNDINHPDSSLLSDVAHLASTFCLFSKLDKYGWIIDSVATDHMCNSIHSFLHLKDLSGHNHYTIPNGTIVRVTMAGDVKLHDDIILKNVLYVPQFRFNLISVQRLCHDNNVSLLFTHNMCMIQAPSMTRPMSLGKIVHGLYCISKPTTTQHKPTNAFF